MRRISSISAFILSLLLCFLLTSCSTENTTPEDPVYVEMQTDITVSSGKAEDYIQRDEYGYTVTRISVEIKGKAELTSLINTELEEWLKYGMETCDTLIPTEGSADRTYRLVNSITYNAGGLLSLRCSVDHSEYGETTSRTLKSAVWDVGRGEKITPLMMLDMSETDYENFLTMNIDPIVSAHPALYPKYLVNGAGTYSEYVDYYIIDNSVYLYSINKDIKYSIEDISFKAAFKDMPELFRYDISAK